MERALVFVGNHHFGVWDPRMAEQNRMCLRSLDYRYFQYLASVHTRQVGKQRAQHAAVALRTAYALSIETLFALVGSAIQAPVCVHAWLGLYRVRDLKDVASYLSGGAAVPNVNKGALSWDALSRIVHACLKLRDGTTEDRIKDAFGRFWRQLAREVAAEESLGEEYNAVKHGFRIQAGGFDLQMGPPVKDGEPSPTEGSWQSLGTSDYGATLLRLLPIGPRGVDREVVIESRNWDPPTMARKLRLVAMSINNVVSHLRILNGEDATKVRFVWPKSLGAFREAWRPMPGVKKFTMGPSLSAADIQPTTRQDVEAVYGIRSDSHRGRAE